MALGFEGPNGGLDGADIIKVESSGLYCDVHDSWSTDKNTIRFDYAVGGNDDLMDVSCITTSEGYIEATFIRLIDTQDTADWPIVENGYTDVFFLWDRFDLEFQPDAFQSMHAATISIRRLALGPRDIRLTFLHLKDPQHGNKSKISPKKQPAHRCL